MAPSSGIKKRRIEDGPENKLKPIIKSEDDDSASGPSGSGNGAATELEGTNFKVSCKFLLLPNFCFGELFRIFTRARYHTFLCWVLGS